MKNIDNNGLLLIVQVEPPQQTDSGDYFYRTHAPGIAMSQHEGIYVVNITNQHRSKTEIMMKADILILKNVCDPDILPLIRGRKEKKRLTVYEIADDLNALQTWNPVYFFYKNRENIELGFRLAHSCNALQVSSSELKRLYGHLNENCIIFPNQILEVPPDRLLQESKGFVIGWGGSHGHLEDMAEIAEPLIHWLISKSDISLHLMCSEPIWKLFDALPQHKKKWVPPGSLNDYYNFLREINIGIAPLRNYAFNRSRSDVKFLEYAVSGAVPVMAHLEPYIESVDNGKTGFLFRNTEELITILDKLTEDVMLTKRIAQEARRYVMRERLQIQHGQDRLNFYRQQMGILHRQETTTGHNAKWFEKLSKIDGAIRKERHLQLQPTRFENLLHDGLIAMQIHHDKQLASKIFEEAVNLEPENYLTFMFAASVSGDPVACLCNALKQEPHSIRTWILLGEEFEIRGKIKEALECYESAINVYPEYEIPYLKIGALLEKSGRQSQSNQFYKRAALITRNLQALNAEKTSNIDLHVNFKNN